MLSAMTIGEWSKRMPCGKCGARDVIYKAARRESAAIPGAAAPVAIDE